MAAMSVVREMHKRLEGNGAEFENKDLAGWMHALRFVLTPRPDLVASATAAGGGSLEAFVVEHLLDLCGATVAPPEFDSAPAAAAPAAAPSRPHRGASETDQRGSDTASRKKSTRPTVRYDTKRGEIFFPSYPHVL